MNKIKGLYRLLRFELPFSAGVCVVLGQILALDHFPTLLSIILGFFSVFLISSSILVMNDYFDLESDMINSPERPIPSKLVKPYEAMIFALVLLFFGIFISYYLGKEVFLISLLLTLIGFLYNRFFKKKGMTDPLDPMTFP